jgi:hypothetical protein
MNGMMMMQLPMGEINQRLRKVLCTTWQAWFSPQYCNWEFAQVRYRTEYVVAFWFTACYMDGIN